MNYIAGFKVTIFNLLCLLVVEDVSPIASAIICEINSGGFRVVPRVPWNPPFIQ